MMINTTDHNTHSVKSERILEVWAPKPSETPPLSPLPGFAAAPPPSLSSSFRNVRKAGQRERRATLPKSRNNRNHGSEVKSQHKFQRSGQRKLQKTEVQNEMNPHRREIQHTEVHNTQNTPPRPYVNMERLKRRLKEAELDYVENERTYKLRKKSLLARLADLEEELNEAMPGLQRPVTPNVASQSLRVVVSSSPSSSSPQISAPSFTAPPSFTTTPPPRTHTSSATPPSRTPSFTATPRGVSGHISPPNPIAKPPTTNSPPASSPTVSVSSPPFETVGLIEKSEIKQEEKSAPSRSVAIKHLVGTSTLIERGFLRLTSAADPAKVRPVSVLQKSFEIAQEKWIKNGDYQATINAFKSIRQDLTVQHIKTDFTISIYETNARICLEVGDLSEFNQCQTQLADLHETQTIWTNSRTEFAALKLLYYVVTENSFGREEMIRMSMSFGKSQANDINSPLVIAVHVAKALMDKNFSRFSKLYAKLTTSGKHLLRSYIFTVRYECLKRICKTCPTYPVSTLQTLLIFENPESLMKYLNSSGIVVDTSGLSVDCKKSVPIFYTPPKKEAKGVTHGLLG